MIIVTRPAPDNERTLARLRKRGLAAHLRPLLERRPLTIVWPTHVDLMMVTSPFAAHLVVEAQVRSPIAALSPTTAAVFRDAGIEPRITAVGGVEALANVLRDFSGSIFYPCSSAALNEPEHQRALAVLGTKVTVIPAYDTRQAPNASELISAAPEDATWLFHSPSAVHAFLAHAGKPPHAVLCSGGSTLRAWRDHKPAAWVDAENVKELP